MYIVEEVDEPPDKYLGTGMYAVGLALLGFEPASESLPPLR
jgi:hypothetical protein